MFTTRLLLSGKGKRDDKIFLSISVLQKKRKKYIFSNINRKREKKMTTFSYFVISVTNDCVSKRWCVTKPARHERLLLVLSDCLKVREERASEESKTKSKWVEPYPNKQTIDRIHPCKKIICIKSVNSKWTLKWMTAPLNGQIFKVLSHRNQIVNSPTHQIPRHFWTKYLKSNLEFK